jgi:hypothetical protein
MSRTISLTKAIPIIAIAWILSLVTTLAVVNLTPANLPKIVSNRIADSAVITTNLADGSVTSAKIQNGTITAVNLADGSIITAKIANGSITTSKISDGAVTTTKIAAGAIATINLADGSVTSAKILDGSVTAVDLADGSITTLKIVDGAVTTSKIADYAVTNLKLAGQAIPFNVTYRTDTITKTTASWQDINGTSVTLDLQRNSTLLIMFSAQTGITNMSTTIAWRAVVDTTVAYPGYVPLQPPGALTYYSSTSYNFYQPNVSAGKHTISMQWYVYSNIGYVDQRTLTVIALPE